MWWWEYQHFFKLNVLIRLYKTAFRSRKYRCCASHETLYTCIYFYTLNFSQQLMLIVILIVISFNNKICHILIYKLLLKKYLNNTNLKFAFDLEERFRADRCWHQYFHFICNTSHMNSPQDSNIKIIFGTDCDLNSFGHETTVCCDASPRHKHWSVNNVDVQRTYESTTPYGATCLFHPNRKLSNH